MLVLKFGGTSAGNQECLKTIIDILKNTKQGENVPVAAVSAFPGITQALVNIAHTAAEGQAYAKLTENIDKDLR